MNGYRNLTSSALTLLKSLLGDFDLDEMVEAQFIMGPLLFTLFIAMAVLVVLNVLIAVVSDVSASVCDRCIPLKQDARYRCRWGWPPPALPCQCYRCQPLTPTPLRILERALLITRAHDARIAHLGRHCDRGPMLR